MNFGLFNANNTSEIEFKQPWKRDDSPFYNRLLTRTRNDRETRNKTIWCRHTGRELQHCSHDATLGYLGVYKLVPSQNGNHSGSVMCLYSEAFGLKDTAPSITCCVLINSYLKTYKSDALECQRSWDVPNSCFFFFFFKVLSIIPCCY